MSKTPVSILQELMIKQHCVPYYEEIKKPGQCGFVIRVKCKDLCADGIGLTKKEAKHDAAKKMLSLMSENNNTSLSILPVVSPVLNMKELVESLPNTTKDSSDMPCLVNYVGLLNELCTKLRLPCPEYNVFELPGPKFTMTCRVNDVKEEATANTKKRAKQEASQKVYNHLNKNKQTFNCNSLAESVTELHVEVMDVKSNALKEIESHQVKTAKALYKTIVKKGAINNRSSMINDYHIKLQTFFLDKITPVKKNMLENTVYSLSKLGNSNNVMTLLNLISETVNKPIERVVLNSKHDDIYVVGYRLTCNPVIAALAMGKTEKLAEINAVIKLVRTIFILIQ